MAYVRYVTSIRVRAHGDVRRYVHACIIHPRSHEALRYQVPFGAFFGTFVPRVASRDYRAVRLREVVLRGGLFLCDVLYAGGKDLHLACLGIRTQPTATAYETNVSLPVCSRYTKLAWLKLASTYSATPT